MSGEAASVARMNVPTAALAAAPVAAATVIGAAAPDALAVALVPAVGMGAAPEAVVVAAVPAVLMVVEPDALVVGPVPAGSVAAVAFSLSPDQAVVPAPPRRNDQTAPRWLFRARQPIRSIQPESALLRSTLTSEVNVFKADSA